jgi:hypothetical protein
LFGDFAAETFSPHYYYGKTLLELTSMERELMETKFDDDKFANGKYSRLTFIKIEI